MRSGMGDAVFAPLYKVLMDPETIQLADGTEDLSSVPGILSLFYIGWHFVDVGRQRNGNRVRSLNFDLPGRR